MSDGRATHRWTGAQQLMVLAGMTGFAISQPILSTLGENPTTLAVHGLEGWALVAFAVLVALGPPLVLWGIVRLLAQVSPAAAGVAVLGLSAVLVALATIQAAKSAGVDGRLILLVVSTGAGVAVAILCARFAPVATWATYTCILPALAVAQLLVLSPASALLTTVGEPEPAQAGGSDAPSVVVLVLDELPTRSLLDDTDQLDRARFPNLAAVADDATWYRHHTSLASQTSVAVPSLLTGMTPREEAPLAANYPDNLFTLLAPTHELEVVESATRLCPYERCDPTSATSVESLGTAQPGLAEMLDLTTEVWLDRIDPGQSAPPRLDDFEEELLPADEGPAPAPDGGLLADRELRATPARVRALIESFDADKGPALYFLHVLLPHQPWRLYPDGSPYGGEEPLAVTLPEADKPFVHTWSPWVAAVNEQRHLLQLQYADRLVGQVTTALKDDGLYDDSLVVITADHGVSFEPRTESRTVEESTTDALAYAPLLVKAPGQARGVVDDSNIEAIDLVPTIAQELGIPLPWETDGSPAGAPAILARGTAKRIGDFRGLAGVHLERWIDFDDATTFPMVDEQRSIGALTRLGDPLAGLVDHLGLETVVGRPLDDLDPDPPAGTLRIPSLDQLRHPSSGPPDGLVSGRVPGAPSSARVVLAVDGEVVAGSELSVDSDGLDGRVLFLLPEGALAADNEIRAALLDGDQVIELNVG
jgi:hypothetical protein